MVWAFWNIGLRLWKASLESYLPFNHNLGLFSEHLVTYNFSTWQTPKFCLSNLIIQVLLRTIKIKTAQFCISICDYPRPPAYNQYTFKRNMKTLNFLFSFTALTSTPKPGLLVSAWDKSPVTLQLLLQRSTKISFFLKYTIFSVSSTLPIPKSQVSVSALPCHTQLQYSFSCLTLLFHNPCQPTLKSPPSSPRIL